MGRRMNGGCLWASEIRLHSVSPLKLAGLGASLRVRLWVFN